MLWVIICSLIGGVLSLIGGVILIAVKKGQRFAVYATAFAAGALLAAAFVDLLPEALEDNEPRTILISTMIGLVFFFLLEGAINWFHRHSHNQEKIEPIVPMIVLGDTIHNFIDGIAIAAGFLISPVSGIIVTLAVAAHEIPQEIGDFGVLLHHGIKKPKVILINVLSALASTVSAIIFYALGTTTDISIAPLLGVVAGFFIYIAATDIIPTIHQEKVKKEIVKKSICLLAGLLLVSFTIVTLHAVTDEYSGHHHDHEDHALCEEDEDHHEE
jgi:zinc and cadmium transporter